MPLLLISMAFGIYGSKLKRAIYKQLSVADILDKLPLAEIPYDTIDSEKMVLITVCALRQQYPNLTQI